MDTKILHLKNDKEVSINHKLVLYYHNYEGEGHTESSTLVIFMGGSQLLVKESYEQVKAILA